MASERVFLTNKITDNPIVIPAGTTWKTVVTFDWRDPVKVYDQIDTTLTRDQTLTLAKTLATVKVVSVLGYLNVIGNLAAGVHDGGWAVRWLRINTTNDTGLQSQSVLVPVVKAGQVAPPHFASPYWHGVNPGGFHLQVRHLTGFFDAFTVDTRDIKVKWYA